MIRKYVAGKTDDPGRTVFLPSATLGPPVPHPDRPEYVPFEVYGRAGWF